MARAAADWSGGDDSVSDFGRWGERGGQPTFEYHADPRTDPATEWDPVTGPPTRRHWIMIGNRRLSVQVASDGTVAVWDGADGHRWLTAPDPVGTGVSVVSVDGGPAVGTGSADWPTGAAPPVRTFGPTWFAVELTHAGVRLERTVHCPEGEAASLLIHVRLESAGSAGSGGTESSGVSDGSTAAAAVRIRHRERWALRPRFVQLATGASSRRQVAGAAVAYGVEPGVARLTARERRVDPDGSGLLGPPGPRGAEDSGGSEPDRAAARAAAAAFGGDGPGAGYRPAVVFGAPRTVVLADLTGGSRPDWSPDPVPGGAHPLLELVTDVVLEPGGSRDLWFRFGLDPVADQLPERTGGPAAELATDRAALTARLPVARSVALPEAAREIPWHVALLTGGACRDEVIGGHTLDQGSAYAYELGMNGAARDPLQHALPLVYSEPDLALSVLRNTCGWATPDGDLPYALDGAKRPWTGLFTPSDQNLYALWLASEYLAATGDVAAFDAPVAYHPEHGAEPVALREHLRRQFAFLVTGVGRGEGGHVRMRNADWNDAAVVASGVDRALMIARGGSVLNSALASWVLGVWAGACERLGEPTAAVEARAMADELRGLVAESWNGRWFRRAYAPGVPPVGDDDCWLEVQPWALLCGAAPPEQAEQLLATIDRLGRPGSPLGTRIRFGAAGGDGGDREQANVWFAVNATLVWAAASVDGELARDEWRRMTLASHTRAFPRIWEGTLSGPDAYNGPESATPGRTWSIPGTPIAMQAFPVANLHSHAQPVLAYLRLLGVEPRPDGSLATAGPCSPGLSFASSTFAVDEAGHGRLTAAGPVVVGTAHGTIAGDRAGGTLRW